MSTRELPNKIYGVDFSGAKEAGKRIWISEGIENGDRLVIKRCFKAAELAGSGEQRQKCLLALKDFIASHPQAAFGVDFPFGLPKKVVSHIAWKEFILSFPSQYDSPDDFRKTCFSKAGNRELKRVTDIQNRAPLSPYNIRVYRQTYYGITKIIYPLVYEDLGCILPMQYPRKGRPWVLEVCPASTLKSEGLYGMYKNRDTAGDLGRVRYHILSTIRATGQLELADKNIVELILADRRGDALDSIIAAFTVFKALKKDIMDQAVSPDYEIEGEIYC